MSLESSTIDLQGKLKPLHRRLIVLCLPNKNKVNGIYMPYAEKGSLTQAQHVWVYSSADDCKHSWPKGFHGMISDGFELEPYDFDLVPTMDQSERETFKTALKWSDEFESKIMSMIVHEDSVMCEVIV